MPGERVIDVGCGSGATAIAFAREVAPSGHVLGVDISGPMLERARQSAPKDLSIDFVRGTPPSIRSSLRVSMCWPRGSA